MGRKKTSKPDRAVTQKAICERMIEGESLRSIVASEGMPSSSTVFRWLADDAAFREQYAHAREAQADAIFDEILEIADDGTNDFVEKRRQDDSPDTVFDAEHVQRSRLRVDARKWVVSKLAPKKYGDDLRLRHADANGQPIEMSPEARATRLAAIFASLERRRGNSENRSDQ